MSGIIRIKKKANPYVCIDKTPLEDQRLSWKARGILAYLLTKPDDWQISITNLENASDPDGRRAVQSGIKELEQNGYVVRQRLQNAKGQFIGWETLIFETPEDIIRQGFAPKSQKRAVGTKCTKLQDTTDNAVSRRRANRPTENSTLIINELVINERLNNSLSLTLSHEPEPEREPEPKPEGREREFEKPKPKAQEAAKETSPLNELNPDEREAFEKFVRAEWQKIQGKEIISFHRFMAMKKDFDVWHERFLKSTDGRKAKEDAIAVQYDWENHPDLKNLMRARYYGGVPWTQEVEAEREWRTAFFIWSRKSERFLAFARELQGS